MTEGILLRACTPRRSGSLSVAHVTVPSEGSWPGTIRYLNRIFTYYAFTTADPHDPKFRTEATYREVPVYDA